MERYLVDDVLPPELVSGIEPGRNLLISGPPMTGKRELLLGLLAQGTAADEGAIVVTTRERATDLLDGFAALSGGERTRVSVIDTVSARSAVADLERLGPVKHVSSPGELTGIGMKFSELARDARDAGVSNIRVGVDSLSPMLMYVDLQQLFRFLHVFTSQIQAQNWLGLFVLEPDSHDEQAVNTLQQLFDGVLDFRLGEDGTRAVRLRGMGDGPTDWFEID